MLLHRIKMNNILSFGPSSTAVNLGKLNVLIGPNASGKSNFLDGIALLRAAPRALSAPITKGGGIREWLWKGSKGSEASIEAMIENPQGNMELRYSFRFRESGQRFQLTDERIENKEPYDGKSETYFYYRYENGYPVINVKNDNKIVKRALRREDIDPEQSILSQRKDPDQYPEITYLGNIFEKIRIYRDWSYGRNAPPRMPQQTDMPNDYLYEDGSNLGLVLNRISRDRSSEVRLINGLKLLYEGISDYRIVFEAGSVQIILHEGDMDIPASRLSDGTLRYLFILAILTDPTPSPLVCIEEPELGLHPDVIGSFADLLLDASQRMQLIITTHSDLLVDALSHTPDAIIICEKHANETFCKHIDSERLKPWLEKYRLGELWLKGEIGGTRW